MRVLINALSPARQFGSADQVADALQRITDCFELMRHSLDAGNVALVYDYRMEFRSLLEGCQTLPESIGRVPDQDLKNLWYHYTRNRTVDAERDGVDVRLFLADSSVSGEMAGEILQEGILIGFRGLPVLEASEISIGTNGVTTRALKSISDEAGFWNCFPLYEPNPKHRLDRYVREGGAEVAPMDLNQDDAQECLLRAIFDEEGVFGISRRSFYRFRSHRDNRYHGFNVDRSEVPRDIAIKLEGR